MVVFVIEHLEPRVWDWCLLEYRHISKIVGKKNLVFTNVARDARKLASFGRVVRKSVAEMRFEKPCLLDPNAGSTLRPADGFQALIFGGILGDDPPRRRTGVLAQKLRGVPRRNLGKKQLSTDTAVLVAKMILDGTPFSRIPFQDGIEVQLNGTESVLLPYRYVLRNNTPVLAPGLREMLRRQKTF